MLDVLLVYVHVHPRYFQIQANPPTVTPPETIGKRGGLLIDIQRMNSICGTEVFIGWL